MRKRPGKLDFYWLFRLTDQPSSTFERYHFPVAVPRCSFILAFFASGAQLGENALAAARMQERNLSSTRSRAARTLKYL